MKLYICTTYYQVLITLVKSLLSNEKYDLYLYNNMAEYSLLKERLERTGCFANIYDFDAVHILEEFSHKNWFERNVSTWWKRKSVVEKYAAIDLHTYSEIYLYADHSIIGRYIIQKKIPYHLIEDALDFFKYFDRYYNVRQENYTPGTFSFFLRSHFLIPCWGMSPYAIDIEVNDIDGIKIPTNKVVQVPRKDMFDSLSNEQRLLIYNTFASGKRVDCYSDKSVLLCTQPLFKDKFVATKVEQEKVFDCAIAQFVAEGYYVVVKPHPRDEIDYMSMVEKYGCGYIDKSLPSEVLNFNPDVAYDAAVSITSTSINFLDFAKEKIFLGREYIKKVLE